MSLAIVTARGGSKGLPRKNLLPLAGIPLIVHTITAGLESQCFARVVVSTDDPEIASVSAAAGAEVLMRPAELATDSASSLDVLAHVLGALPQHATFALLQPTSPLRSAIHVREAWALFTQSGATSCVSVTPAEHPPQKCLYRDERGDFQPLFDRASLTAPRQKLVATYRVNGAVYFNGTESFLRSRDLFADKLVCYEMGHSDSIDIDSAEDLALAEILYARRAASR